MSDLLPQLLLDTVRRAPHRTAVICGDRRLSYGELDTASETFAAALQATDVRSGERVGVYLPKSAEAIAATFGILRAAGVYVPIDAGAPVHRALQIMQDCGIQRLVTTRERACRLAERGLPMRHVPPDAVKLRFDGGGPRDASSDIVLAVAPPSTKPASVPGVRGDGEDPAYILYTSGSTGVPKGVVISHRAALTFINWTHREFGICERDVVCCPAPLHFDLSILDVFSTIKAGGTVAIVPEHLATFPVLLSQFIGEHGVTIWYSVPSALVSMLNRGRFTARSYPVLRIILFAGEVFPIKYLRTLRESTTARLFNLYGPTETNVCTFYEVVEVPRSQVAPAPIGRATPDYTVFAVNDAGKLVGPGETGELYAGGPGVMSGYWGDPEKTGKILVPSPLPNLFAGVMCRTGDLVTLDGAGNYAYLGRRDHLVKSRGYRIELGEIETVLYGHPQVREVALVAVPDQDVTNRLKAVIVAKEPSGLAESEIQRYCAERLPKYMVPEIIEFRTTLPRTSTGKVDRPALAAG
jgi:L-proline---[L-prolyl-carrier protein] ligase